MKVPARMALLLAIVLPVEAAAANCVIPRFTFNTTSQGPWPARMIVKSGANCGSRYWTFNTFTAKRLYLANTPQHGKVALSAPGGYRYFAPTGYTSNDSFTLKLCGTNFGRSDGCADLLFSVNVVN